MSTKYRNLVLGSVLLASPLALLGLPAHAQFGALMQQLQAIKAPAGVTPQRDASAVSGPQDRSGRKGGLMPSDQWCAEQAGVLGNLKPDTSVITSEFKVTDLESLQDLFLVAFNRTGISKTFPNVRFFQAAFETKKVRAIYDTFLAFPEPATLAVLIQLTQAQDPQERGDALMALAFLHLQAPDLSVRPSRWQELHQTALQSPHYTAQVFRARVAAYGEYGRKDLGVALGDLVSAGQLKSEYQSSEYGKEFDTQNYELVHTATAKDIYNNEPSMPFRQQWAGPAKTAMQIEAAQQAYAAHLPKTRLGKMYAEATRFNNESINIGNELIKSTQGGNQFAGQLASLNSLKSTAQGDKQVFGDISPDIQTAQLRMLTNAGTLDEQQKKMLAQAQEKRLAAQGLISQTYSELLNTLFSSFSGDMVKMAAPLPALQQANNALIQSCLISSKWEQAMRAKDVPTADKSKVVATLAETADKYKD